MKSFLPVLLVIFLNFQAYGFEHNTYYDVELKTHYFEHQGGTSGCWLFAGLGIFESYTDDQDTALVDTIDMSEDYLLIVWTKHQVAKALKKAGHSVYGSGYFYYMEKLLNEYGIVPETSWTPKVSFKNEYDETRRFFKLLNYLIQGYHEKNLTAANEEGRRKNLKEAKESIEEVFDYYVGDLPSKFLHEGVEYTPQEFYKYVYPEAPKLISYNRKEFSVEHAENLIKKMKAGGWFPPSEIRYYENIVEFQKLERRNVGIENYYKNSSEMLDIIVSEINEGRPVYVGLNWVSTFIKDDEIMTMDPDIHGLPIAPPEIGQFFNFIYDIFSYTGHAMIAVGYDIDEATGEVIKLKLKNSYGKYTGDRGFIHIYKDYFDRFVTRISLVHVPGRDLTGSILDPSDDSYLENEILVLVDELKDDDVQYYAMKNLIKIGPKILPYMEGAINDDSAYWVLTELSALGEAAMDYFESYIAADAYVYEAASALLKSGGTGKVVPRVLGHLNNSRQYSLLNAVWEMEGVSALPYVMPYLLEEIYYSHLEDGILQLGDPAKEYLQNYIQENNPSEELKLVLETLIDKF